MFALVNGLAFGDRLSARERRWRRENNDWFESRFTDPFAADPSLLDRSVHPTTSSWFRTDAVDLVERTEGYLDILTAHEVPWVELRSEAPGPVLFADDEQLLVAASHDPVAIEPALAVCRRFDPNCDLNSPR